MSKEIILIHVTPKQKYILNKMSEFCGRSISDILMTCFKDVCFDKYDEYSEQWFFENGGTEGFKEWD